MDRYEARCAEVFKDLRTGRERENPDQQPGPVSMHDYADCYRSNKYDVYDLSDVDATGANLSNASAVQGVLDFISGLKQTRADVKKTVD